MRVDLPELFPAQQEIAQDPHRFKVVAAGRRFGKTKLAALMCVIVALRGGRAWWVAPSFSLADVGWREIKLLCGQIKGAQVRLGVRAYYMPGGGFVQAKSAGSSAALRGEGLDFVVVDECAYMDQTRWTVELRPALSDRKGKAVFISTPNGRNWFWRLWKQGMSDDPKNKDWKSWQLPSTARPTFDPSEIESARADMTEREIRQEYFAQFMADSGQVFRHIDKLTRSTALDRGLEGHTYVAGMDLGRYNDATAIAVFDVGTGEQVLLETFVEEEFSLQATRVQGIHARFAPKAWIIEENFNTSYIERLRDLRIPVVPIHVSNPIKGMLITDLTLAFEQELISLIPHEDQNHQLKAFTFSTTGFNNTRYHAPGGEHDDIVIANALAWHGLKGAAIKPASTYGLKQVASVSHVERPGPQKVLTPGGVGGPYNTRRPRPLSRFRSRLVHRLRY